MVRYRPMHHVLPVAKALVALQGRFAHPKTCASVIQSLLHLLSIVEAAPIRHGARRYVHRSVGQVGVVCIYMAKCLD